LKFDGVKLEALPEEGFTHREALAALSGEELARLKEASDAPGLVHLAGHVALLAATGTAVLLAPNWPLWVLAVIAHGIVLIFLFTLEHEAVHGTAFRSAWINRTAAEVTGFLVVVPPRWFRYFHFAHHRHTQDPERDPELATPKPHDRWSYVRHLSGLPYWKAEIGTIINNALGRSVGCYVPPAARSRVIAEARAYLAGYAAFAAVAFATGWTWPLELWLVPLIAGQPFLRAYLLAEHGACPLVADMLANTRTTFASRFVRFLAWNMPYHTAHHVLPVVPFHRLRTLTAILETRLACTANGYFDAHRQIRAGWGRDHIDFGRYAQEIQAHTADQAPRMMNTVPSGSHRSAMEKISAGSSSEPSR
jgi:fatty acid desaturase